MANNSTIAFVGDYPPRQCGIATFTQDINERVARHGKGVNTFVVAINDKPDGYAYPPCVRFEIRESVLADYRQAAEFLNISQVSVVSIQHEYGIFGGTCGSHLLSLLRRLRRPVVTTLHTVLKAPSDQQRHVLQEVARLSNRLVVMSDSAKAMLQEVYNVPAEKIASIPHGIPDLPFTSEKRCDDKLAVRGKKVLLTFGLLSPGKGIEYVIESLPAILEKHPDVVYILVGATHPHVKRHSGEEYRNGLARRVRELGIEDSVIFMNRFVELDELREFLMAADVYVTPYLNEAQITSGTLAYAMGAGNAVISTPYWYAREMLSDGRGRLVPFRDSAAIAGQVIDLFDNPDQLQAVRRKAYKFCRKMIWKQVARDYLALFSDATAARVERRRYAAVGALSGHWPKEDELPELDLRHMRAMTDDVGMFQHCLYAIPDRRHGYCTDDNARALIVAARLWNQTRDDSAYPFMQTYLSFLNDAFDGRTGWLRTFMDYDRTWQPTCSEDAHARGLWGLGTAVALASHEPIVALASQLFLRALPVAEEFTSPRAWAYALLGIVAYLERFGGDRNVLRFRNELTDRLVQHFLRHRKDDWPWCEETVTYANATLVHALLASGASMLDNEVIKVASKSLDWLLEVQIGPAGSLSVIGNRGWYTYGGAPAQFDQQPIEANALVEACIEAYHIDKDPRWARHASWAFDWFLGHNDIRTPLYDSTTGGCRDGMHVDRVNENQGAESTLAWLMSLLSMHALQTGQSLGDATLSARTVADTRTYEEQNNPRT